MSNAAGIGAPKGGRVHWFLLNLDKYVRKNYTYDGKYQYHCYKLDRKATTKEDKQTADTFIVWQSPARWNVVHFSAITGIVQNKGFLKSKQAAEWVGELAYLEDYLRHDEEPPKIDEDGITKYLDKLHKILNGITRQDPESK